MDGLISRWAAIEAMNADNLNRNMDSVFDDDLRRAADRRGRIHRKTNGADLRELRQAARWFSDNWERPAHWSEKRADNAEIALAYFGG